MIFIFISAVGLVRISCGPGGPSLYLESWTDSVIQLMGYAYISTIVSISLPLGDNGDVEQWDFEKKDSKLVRNCSSCCEPDYESCSVKLRLHFFYLKIPII